MTKAILSFLCAGAAALCIAPAQAQTAQFTADISGQVNSASHNGPSLFQVGPAASNEGNPALNGPAGQFNSYSASAGLPQIKGNDLSKYGFSLYTSSVTPLSNNVVDYNGTFRIFAPGYGYTANDGDILEHGNFTTLATFTDPYNATLAGVFTADPGFLQPKGFPVPVDFSLANPAQFKGTFHSDPNGNQSLKGTLQSFCPTNNAAVPEAGTLPLLAVGGLALGLVAVRRKRSVCA